MYIYLLSTYLVTFRDIWGEHKVSSFNPYIFPKKIFQLKKVKSRDEDPTFFSIDPAQGEENPAPTPDPTLIQKKKLSYILGR